MRFSALLFLLLVCGPSLLGLAPLAAQQQDAAPQGGAPQGGPPLNNRICIIDKTKAVDGQTFQSCDAPPENNALLAKGFMIARLDRGTIKSKQPIWVHGLCRFIDNRSPTQDVLVPFGTPEEWTTFNQLVPGILKVAGCCTPRPITARDIPEPTTPCIGKWVLQQVVSASSVASQATSAAEQVPDEKMKLGGGDGLVSSTGSALEFPLARDDDNTAYTQDGLREFAARWSCENDEGNTAPVAAPSEGDDTPASHSDMLYVSFTMNCTHEQWTPVLLQTFCVAAETSHAYPCEAAGYPAGTQGDIIMYEKTLCPKGTTTRSLIKDTCVGEKIAPASAEAQPNDQPVVQPLPAASGQPSGQPTGQPSVEPITPAPKKK